MAEADYSAVDDLVTKQNEYLDAQQTQYDEIVDKGIEQQEALAEKEKAEYDEEATKTAKGLYTNYKKESNQYGVNAENRASQGLANSGYAESSQVSLYNTYQTNVTETIKETNKLKAEVDFNLNQAYLDADIQKAQNMVSIYQQKAELALTEYNLRYTIYRDAVADEQWEKEYELSLRQLEQSQSQWEAEYALSKQSLEASNSSSGSSGKSSSSGNGTIPDADATIDTGSDGTTTESTMDISQFSSGATFLWNQITSNASMLTDTKVKAMINQALTNNQISTEEAQYIRNLLGY